MIGRFFYLLKEGIKNTWKNSFMSIASIGILVTCLIILGTFALASENINTTIAGLANDNEIAIFIDDSVSTKDARDMQTKIAQIENINAIQFIDKDTAWEEYLSTLADPDSYRESIEGSPLRDEYVVTLKDISKMSQTVEELKALDNVANVTYREDVAQNLVKLRNMLSVIFVTFMVILVSLSVFIISNTIKLGMFARRKEINIMKYVGATNSFIRLPFTVEGVIIGLLSGGIAYGLQWYIYTYLVDNVVSEFNLFSLVPFMDYAIPLLIAFLAVGVIVGWVSSMVSIRKYLNV